MNRFDKVAKRFTGFPPDTLYTPVPNPLFGPLLEAIQDLTELKCTLRVLWLLHQKKKRSPRFVTQEEVLSDAVLLHGLKGLDVSPQEAIHRGLDRAVERGVLLGLGVTVNGQQKELYFLNTPHSQRAVESIKRGELPLTELPKAQIVSESTPGKPNIFELYENNIGILTPMVAEKLKDAEENYPWDWIVEATKLAVSRKTPKWEYIEEILRNWASRGIHSYGKPRRDTEKVSLKEYLRRQNIPSDR